MNNSTATTLACALMNVANINTFEKLRAANFVGPDASLEISLREYGFAYRNCEDTGEIVCIYGIKRDNEGEYVAFDRCTFSADLDVYKEFNWIKDWQHEVFCYFDCDQEYFDNLDLGQKLYWLLEIFGYDNIFGSSYWEGFKISGDNN